MTDPTIPELVARLREIDSEWGDNWTLGIDEAGNLLVLDGEGEFVGALHEDSDRLAEAVCELRKALPVILDALDHIGDANKMVAHSPDGGKVGELDHAECSVSTGIDGALTAGQGELAPSGYWEHPCHECAYRANASEVRRLQDIVDDLESRSTWRPITQVPTAEEHAWCKNSFLVERTYDGPEGTLIVVEYPSKCWARMVEFYGHPEREGWKRYMLIPPSNHSTNESEET